MILGVVCNDTGLQNLLAITKRILTFIQILGPLLCMISLVIIFVQLINNPEEKKLKGKIKNCLIALVLLFMIPVLVDAAMKLADDSLKISSCWNNAESNMEGSEYIESGEKRKTGFLVDPGSYENGKASDSKSSNNNIKKPDKNKKTNILFIGNSMTYRESNAKQRITEIFKGMAKNGGYSNFNVYVANRSGSSLSQIAAARKGVITARKYDIVILQERTQEYESSGYGAYLKGATTIKKLVNQKNSDAIIYIRQKWVNQKSLNKSIQKKAYKNASTVASKIGAGLIYDGKAFDSSISKYPNINLYSDTRHQSAYGAYLSAACIYKTVTGSDPNSLTYNGYLGESSAKKLRGVASSTC